MNYWKWSNGEAYYKSARPEKTQNQSHESQNYNSQLDAINQSLEGYRETEFNESRRENIDEKLSDREMMTQRGGNPFFQTSYVNDIVTRDMYLKPINTTQGRTKVSSTEE
jgi:hypothetical protein